MSEGFTRSLSKDVQDVKRNDSGTETVGYTHKKFQKWTILVGTRPIKTHREEDVRREQTKISLTLKQ